MRGREEFLEILEACERTSALLLLSMDSGAQNQAHLAALREQEVEGLSTALPAELRAEDLERLKVILRVGEEVRLRAISEKNAATRSLAALCGGLQLARQLAASQDPRESEVDCMG